MSVLYDIITWFCLFLLIAIVLFVFGKILFHICHSNRKEVLPAGIKQIVSDADNNQGEDYSIRRHGCLTTFRKLVVANKKVKLMN